MPLALKMNLCCALHLMNLLQDDARKVFLLPNFATVRPYTKEKTGRAATVKNLMKTIRRKSQGGGKRTGGTKGIKEQTCLK